MVLFEKMKTKFLSNTKLASNFKSWNFKKYYKWFCLNLTAPILKGVLFLFIAFGNFFGSKTLKCFDHWSWDLVQDIPPCVDFKVLHLNFSSIVAIAWQQFQTCRKWSSYIAYKKDYTFMRTLFLIWTLWDHNLLGRGFYIKKTAAFF